MLARVTYRSLAAGTHPIQVFRPYKRKNSLLRTLYTVRITTKASFSAMKHRATPHHESTTPQGVLLLRISTTNPPQLAHTKTTRNAVQQQQLRQIARTCLQSTPGRKADSTRLIKHAGSKTTPPSGSQLIGTIIIRGSPAYGLCLLTSPPPPPVDRLWPQPTTTSISPLVALLRRLHGRSEHIPPKLRPNGPSCSTTIHHPERSKTPPEWIFHLRRRYTTRIASVFPALYSEPPSRITPLLALKLATKGEALALCHTPFSLSPGPLYPSLSFPPLPPPPLSLSAHPPGD